MKWTTFCSVGNRASTGLADRRSLKAGIAKASSHCKRTGQCPGGCFGHLAHSPVRTDRCHADACLLPVRLWTTFPHVQPPTDIPTRRSAPSQLLVRLLRYIAGRQGPALSPPFT